MIIKTWRKLAHTNILELTLITTLIGTIALKKHIMEDERHVLVLRTTINQHIYQFWEKKNSSLRLLLLVILYGCEVWGCNISREYWRKIEQT
jgi:hypothetical protein